MSFCDDVRDAPFERYQTGGPLDALRAWQQAAPCDRALVIEGMTGAAGVVLRERRAGAWYAAGYGSAATAAIALTEAVRWRRVDPPPLAGRVARHARGGRA